MACGLVGLWACGLVGLWACVFIRWSIKVSQFLKNMLNFSALKQDFPCFLQGDLPLIAKRRFLQIVF